MKKLLFISTMLCASIALSQEYATTETGKVVQLNKNGTYKYVKPKESSPIYETDFKKKDGKVSINNKTISLILADKKMQNVDLTFQSTERQFMQTNVDNMNIMVANANIEAMSRMKNKYTYMPRSVYMYFSENINKWIVSITYTSENDYGGSKEGKAVCSMKSDGTFYDIEFI